MFERHRDLIIHFVRIAGSAGLYAAAMAGDLLSIAVLAAGATFFAVFFLAHDLVHGSLGLPPRARRQVRAAAAQLLLISGEVMRLSHLRHHARPFAPDDLEGVAVRLGLTRTMRALPYLFIVLRIAVFGGAGPASRRRQLLEHALNAGGLAVGLLVPALRPYVVVALLAQLLVPIWAGYVPHRAPAWLLRCARRLAATGSPLAIGLAYHDLHHDDADIPSGRLGDQRWQRGSATTSLASKEQQAHNQRHQRRAAASGRTDGAAAPRCPLHRPVGPGIHDRRGVRDGCRT